MQVLPRRERAAATSETVFGVSESSIARARAALAGLPKIPWTAGLIPANIHGFFDYLLGFGALAAPRLFGFADNTEARLAVQIPAFTLLGYSLFTNYRWGLFRVIPFASHLMLDLLSGVTVLALPRLLGLRRWSWLFTTLGLIEIFFALFTQRESETEREGF